MHAYFTYIYIFFVIHGANKHNCTVFLYIAYLHIHGATKQKHILLYFMYMSMHNLYFTHTYIYIHSFLFLFLLFKVQANNFFPPVFYAHACISYIQHIFRISLPYVFFPKLQ